MSIEDYNNMNIESYNNILKEKINNFCIEEPETVESLVESLLISNEEIMSMTKYIQENYNDKLDSELSYIREKYLLMKDIFDKINYENEENNISKKDMIKNIKNMKNYNIILISVYMGAYLS